MKELSDKKFDELLKHKADSVDFEFDESAWDKMEQKLRRKDRVVLIRNSSFALLLILFSALLFIQTTDNTKTDNDNLAKKSSGNEARQQKLNADAKVAHPDSNKNFENPRLEIAESSNNNNAAKKRVEENEIFPNSIHPGNEVETDSSALTHSLTNTPTGSGTRQNSSVILGDTIDNRTPALASLQDSIAIAANTHIDTAETSSITKPAIAKTDSLKKNRKRSIPKLSLSAMLGPDFSTVESFSGSKGNLSIGLSLNLNFSKRLALSSGLRYGVKNYTANAYDYTSSNPRAAYIEGIDASCDILEIPLQASVTVLSRTDRSFSLNTGISSYLMLKEKYDFRYTAASGYKTYTLNATNKNQHYFSVLSLGASYQLRSKSLPLIWGIEPYLKLPLGGVGEGDIRLKSGGVNLILTYELKRK